MGKQLWPWLLGAALLAGCRGTGYDRIPATAVDNPDPLVGSQFKARPETEVAAAPVDPARPVQGNDAPASRAVVTSQPAPAAGRDRIGPLTIQPQQPPATLGPATASPGLSPGTASLTLGVREPRQGMIDTQVQPAGTMVPAANPELVQRYRQQLTDKGAIGLRTKQVSTVRWEALAHFPDPKDAAQLRRIESQGTTEADALLAIIEQLERAGK